MKQCPSCGNFVEDNAKFCNSCGQAIPEQTYQQPQQPNYNQPQQPVYNAQPVYNNQQMNPSTGKATASLVLGIVSFFCCGLILGIIGFVLGNSYLKDPMSNPAGFGTAKAGKICSLISIICWAVFVAIYVILIITGAAVATASASYYY